MPRCFAACWGVKVSSSPIATMSAPSRRFAASEDSRLRSSSGQRLGDGLELIDLCVRHRGGTDGLHRLSPQVSHLQHLSQMTQRSTVCQRIGDRGCSGHVSSFAATDCEAQGVQPTTHSKNSSAVTTGFSHRAAFFAFDDCDPASATTSTSVRVLRERRHGHEPACLGHRVQLLLLEPAVPRRVDGAGEAHLRARHQHVSRDHGPVGLETPPAAPAPRSAARPRADAPPPPNRGASTRAQVCSSRRASTSAESSCAPRFPPTTKPVGALVPSGPETRSSR